MSRSYYTYQQIVVRAVVELQQEHNGSRSRSFHTNTIHKKVRDFAQADEVHLGPHWTRYIAKAVAQLIKADVFHNQRGYIALSPNGVKNLARSRQRYGALHELSPFKKSQFLKTIVGEPNAVRLSGTASQLSRKSISQEKVIASLRASLAKFKGANKSIAFELELTRRERDDLQLTLLDMKLPSTLPSQLGSAALRVSDTLVPSYTSCTPIGCRPEPTIPSNLDSLRAPSPDPGYPRTSRSPSIDPRPTTSFTHRASGSFLNTISNQFTPSPSPGPVHHNSAGIITGCANRVCNESNGEGSGNSDFADVEMGDMDEPLEGDDVVGLSADSDVMRGMHVENEASDETLGIDPKVVAAAQDAQDLESLQQFAVAKQEHDILTQKLVSVTQDRDSLLLNEVELHAMLKDCEDQVDSLKVELTSATRAFDALQTQKEACEDARAVTEAENVRISREIADRTSEVLRLTDRVAELSAEIFQSKGQRDDAQSQLTSTYSQLETTDTRLRTTCAELAATQVQLDGAHHDLCIIWRELQSSKAQHGASQEQLESAQREFHAICSELDVTKAGMDVMSVQLNVTSEQLQDSNAQLNAANAQLDGMRSDLQRLQGVFRQAEEVERTLRDEIKDMTENLATSQAHLTHLTQESAVREHDLKSQLEDAQERVAVLEEDLQSARTAWTRAIDVKRAAAEADEEIQQLLFRQHTQKRDPSFRDSGISITM